MQNLFEPQQWTGTFFPPGGCEQRFAGTLRYSPNGGVVLSYTIPGFRELPECTELHGILDDGSRCTLVGSFSMCGAGSTLKHGQESRSGKQSFYFLVIGGFYSHDAPVEDVSFTLTGLQEFFFPAGYKDLVKFSNAPLATVSVPFGTIEITNVASFGFVPKDITSQIYCRDPDAIEALKLAFEKIEKEHPQAPFMLKKDIAYRLRLRFSAGVTLESAYQKISEIAGLFAMLNHGPTHPESLNITRQTEGGRPASEDVYPAMGLNQSTIDICTRKASHFQMPITQHTIDLSKLLTTWPENASHFETAVSAIQHEIGFRTTHSAHGDIVLYATQLDYISHAAGRAKANKYSFPLDAYACVQLRERLAQVFAKVGVSDLGKGISDLRNDIAHIGRPPKMLADLNLADLVCIAACLQLTVIGFAFERLGVAADVRKTYQTHFLPR